MVVEFAIQLHLSLASSVVVAQWYSGLALERDLDVNRLIFSLKDHVNLASTSALLKVQYS